MSCKSCQSANQRTLNGEIAIHSPGLKGLDKPIVWVFPKLLLCLNCGFTEFAIPEAELRRLLESDAAVRPRGRFWRVHLKRKINIMHLRIRQLPALNSTTDKIITAKDRFHSSKEFTHGISLQHIPLCSGAQSCPYHVCVAVVS